MPQTKSGSISKSVRVGKFTGIGFLSVATARGDVKMFHGDHIVEVDYTRETRVGDLPGVNGVRELNVSRKTTSKTATFVVSEDAARALGIFLSESVEEEQARLAAIVEPEKEVIDEKKTEKNDEKK